MGSFRYMECEAAVSMWRAAVTGDTWNMFIVYGYIDILLSFAWFIVLLDWVRSCSVHVARWHAGVQHVTHGTWNMFMGAIAPPGPSTSQHQAAPGKWVLGCWAALGGQLRSRDHGTGA